MFILKEQLEIVTQELKSARTIISLLKEDSNSTCDFPAMDSPLQGQPTANIQSAMDLNWNTVTCKANKKKVLTPNNIWMTELQQTSTNRFSPLDNLKVLQKKNEPASVKNSVNPPINRPRMNSSGTNKIPTIINGRVENSAILNSYKNKMKTLKVKPTKNNKYVHKVHRIGDSHLKSVTTKINQYLGSNFVVSSFVKPGAIKQITETQEKEFKCLGRKDLLVISGGSNDLANNPGVDKSALLCLLKFVQKYANTNVPMLNVPIRYDPLTNYRTNHNIKNFNDKLQKSIKLLNHVHLIEMTTDRKYLTKYGLHQNNLGKERLAKEIACHIREIVNSGSINEPAYPLHWKDEHISMNSINDIALPLSCFSNEGNVSEPVTKLPHEHCNSQNKAEMGAMVEIVVDNRVSDKVEDEISEPEAVSEFEFKTVNAKETGDESVKVEVNKDETRVLCIGNSETKKVEEVKCNRVSKIMNDTKSDTVLVYDKSVTERADEDFSETGEKKLYGSDAIKVNNDTSNTDLAVSYTSVSKLCRSSSRNKIPASRRSDFLW